MYYRTTFFRIKSVFSSGQTYFPQCTILTLIPPKDQVKQIGKGGAKEKTSFVISYFGYEYVYIGIYACAYSYI
jgi:hypothetical protein